MINQINTKNKDGKEIPTKNRICIFRDTITIMLEAMFTTGINEWNRQAKGFSIMNDKFFNKINE